MKSHVITRGGTSVLIVELNEEAARASRVNPHDAPALFVRLDVHPRPSFIAVASWLHGGGPHDLTDLIVARLNFGFERYTAEEIARAALDLLPKPERE